MRHALGSLAHAAVLTFIVLHCPATSAAEGENVEVLTPLTKVTSSISDLREACRGAGQYDACTRMIAYRLEAACSVEGNGWKLEATARFRPWIFLYNVRRLTHETEHVEDIRRSAERYVSGLESIRFESLAVCESRGLAERAGFEMQMASFALESNLARHPQLRVMASR